MTMETLIALLLFAGLGALWGFIQAIYLRAGHSPPIDETGAKDCACSACAEAPRCHGPQDHP